MASALHDTPTLSSSSVPTERREGEVAGLEPEPLALEMEGVSRSFGDVVALDDVSFHVRRGEIVGLLGPNGAGKSTALRILATLMQPDRGHARVRGFDTQTDPLEVRRVLGYQTGDTGLYQRLTPREFLLYFARLHGIPDAEARIRVGRAVREFQLEGFADRVCRGLSTGQRQRVSLARTTLHEPVALILDEPSSGLDVVAAAEMTSHLRRLADEGAAILFSTHVLSEVELLCERVVVIDRGRVVANGTVDALREETGCDGFARAFLSIIDRSRRAAQHVEAADA
jgi:sodium transport system ATP-binding protein